MSKKIAAQDATAMNSLYKGELGRLGLKVAQKDGKEGVMGISHDPQAFTDHDEYMKTLEQVLKEDAKVDGESANDPITD